MSEHSTPEERTEMPTDRRMNQLRKEGQLHHSTEIVHVASLLSGFLVLQFSWDWFVADMKYCLIKSFSMIADSEPLDVTALQQGGMNLFYLLAPELLILSIVIGFVASMAMFLQTNFNIKNKIIDPKFSNLNPISGIKKVFSAQGVMTTLKSVVKLCVILPIGYFGLEEFAPEMVQLMHLTVDQVLYYTGKVMFDLFWQIMYILIVLALIDWFWTRYQWLKQNKMTKDEVKDERKSIEGDEATKRKIQQKGLQRIMQRIRESVPQADVVITNPTHYAVALKYDRETMKAPTVVAKGKGFLALRIRAIAQDAGVPILERKPLARALYAGAEVGSEIPHELFKAVARVLAYVYKLKHPHRYARTTS